MRMSFFLSTGLIHTRVDSLTRFRNFLDSVDRAWMQSLRKICLNLMRMMNEESNTKAKSVPVLCRRYSSFMSSSRYNSTHAR